MIGSAGGSCFDNSDVLMVLVGLMVVVVLMVVAVLMGVVGLMDAVTAFAIQKILVLTRVARCQVQIRGKG